MIPMPIMPIRGPSSGLATRSTWWRASIRKSQPRSKPSPANILLPRFSRPRRPKTKWQAWRSAQTTTGTPSDKTRGDVCRRRLCDREHVGASRTNAMELLGPTRPDPHKGPYNADGFVVDVENQRAVVPGKTSTQCSHIKDSYMGTSTTVWSGVVSATTVRCRNNVRAPRVDVGCW